MKTEAEARRARLEAEARRARLIAEKPPCLACGKKLIPRPRRGKTKQEGNAQFRARLYCNRSCSGSASKGSRQPRVVEKREFTPVTAMGKMFLDMPVVRDRRVDY